MCNAFPLLPNHSCTLLQGQKHGEFRHFETTIKKANCYFGRSKLLYRDIFCVGI